MSHLSVFISTHELFSSYYFPPPFEEEEREWCGGVELPTCVTPPQCISNPSSKAAKCSELGFLVEVQWDISMNLSGFTKIFPTVFFLRNNNLRRGSDFIFSTAM